MNTVGQALDRAARRLAGDGVDQARREARLLLGHAIGDETDRLITEPEGLVSPQDMTRFEAALGRRARREPVARILGRREFWSLDIAVNADVLDPRADSETVVEVALAAIADRSAPIRILDFGTGSGCLLLALLSEFDGATGLGLDVSTGAISLARANAETLGFVSRARFVVGDWGAALRGRFDLIVANPPYIAESEIDRLEPEVAAYDPRLALAGGADGLEAYRALAPDLVRLLAPEGLAVLEIGAGQGAAVTGILAAHRLEIVKIRADLVGVDRCLLARRATELTDV